MKRLLLEKHLRPAYVPTEEQKARLRAIFTEENRQAPNTVGMFFWLAVASALFFWLPLALIAVYALTR